MRLLARNYFYFEFDTTYLEYLPLFINVKKTWCVAKDDYWSISFKNKSDFFT